MLIALLGIKVSACNEFGAFRVRKRYFIICACKDNDFCCRGVDALRYRLWPRSDPAEVAPNRSYLKSIIEMGGQIAHRYLIAMAGGQHPSNA